MKKFLAKGLLAGAALLSVAGLASCGSNSSTSSTTSAVSSAAEEEEDLGFTEVAIFENVQKEFLNLSGVYFQPVSMTDGLKAEDFDCHLELDISALENNLGYGVGDWVPYLTVDYAVTQDSKAVSSGTFMPMMASDGPHYGANIKLNGNGTYAVKFTIKFPDTATAFLIHTDNTGPEGHAFPNTIEYEYTSWKFVEGAWNE